MIKKLEYRNETESILKKGDKNVFLFYLLFSIYHGNKVYIFHFSVTKTNLSVHEDKNKVTYVKVKK